MKSVDKYLHRDAETWGLLTRFVYEYAAEPIEQSMKNVEASVDRIVDPVCQSVEEDLRLRSCKSVKQAVMWMGRQKVVDGCVSRSIMIHFKVEVEFRINDAVESEGWHLVYDDLNELDR